MLLFTRVQGVSQSRNSIKSTVVTSWVREKNHRHAKSWWMASIMEDLISRHCGTTPEVIRIEIQREYDVYVSYYRSWKEKGLALEEIHGN